MTSEEYREMLDALFREYVRNRIQNVNKEELVNNMARVKLATGVLEKLKSEYSNKPEEVGARPDVPQILEDLKEQIAYSEELFARSGLFDALDKKFDEIAGNAEKAIQPDFELEILKNLNSTNPSQEIGDAVAMLKRLASTGAFQQKENTANEALKEAKELIVVAQTQLQTKDGKSKFWRKLEPVAKIFRGVGTAGFNIAAGCGVLPTLGIVLPPAAIIGGGAVILSSINGVGLILEGTAKLKNG